jgi:hypothetical protein
MPDIKIQIPAAGGKSQFARRLFVSNVFSGVMGRPERLILTASLT